MGCPLRSVCLVTMATGRYHAFLPSMVESAFDHLKGLETVCVLAEQPRPVSGHEMLWLPWGHFPWPYPTLLRYRAMSSYAHTLGSFDFVLYTDVDMLFVGDVDVDDVHGILAVQHPGHVGRDVNDFPYERRPESNSYIAPGDGKLYYCGGVQGGSANAYLAACSTIAGRIDDDLLQRTIPVWHDESAWNRYCLDHPPDTVFGPEYCTPDTARQSSSRILALSKNHDHYREVPIHERIRSLGRRVAHRLF